jgi:hypothetical protein
VAAKQTDAGNEIRLVAHTETSSETTGPNLPPDKVIEVSKPVEVVPARTFAHAADY